MDQAITDMIIDDQCGFAGRRPHPAADLLTVQYQ